MIPTFASEMFEKLAPEFGVKIWVEPSWRTVGYIELKDGKRRYWSGSALDFNTLGAAEISRDKAYTNDILREAGFTVPRGRAFGSKEWCEEIGSKDGLAAALIYALTIGFPIIAKPNSSQGGRLVYRAMEKEELSTALRAIFSEHKLAIVEEYKSGVDARILVLDTEVVLAYERLPLTIRGDGIHSIRELMINREESLKKAGRPVRIREEEARMVFFLRSLGIETLEKVLNDGEDLVLLPNANLATGGSVKDITAMLHQTYRELAVSAVRLLNLRFAGVDIMGEPNCDWSKPASNKTTILEVNGKQPGVTHFACEHMSAVEDFYRKLFRALIDTSHA